MKRILLATPTTPYPLQPWHDTPTDITRQRFFKGHPYLASFSGTEESLTHLTREDIKKYYADTFAPERLAVIAVGKFDENELLLPPLRLPNIPLLHQKLQQLVVLIWQTK